jgi:homoserine dehydrogenase
VYKKDEVVVLKFGSSVLRDQADLPRAVHEIYRWWRQGTQVLAVVSAFGDTTDQLLRSAETVCAKPECSIMATLLATGEATSSALLGLALNRAGIPARVLDPAQAGLHTVGGTLDADLISVDVARLREELRQAVVVLPGFVGRGENGQTTLLGRGGSDLSALFLAHRLGGKCVLLKDVDGIYASDPATATARPVRFSELKYETASKVSNNLVQPKAIRFAAAHGLQFVVSAIGSGHQTLVGAGADRLAVTKINPPLLRVALLGCGTVGGGVYQALAALPQLFTVTGVAARSPEGARSASVPAGLISDSPEELIAGDCDVVVELIGGTKAANSLVTHGLQSGRHVVTANKALMAIDGKRLATLAADVGVSLRYSAAIGGVMPALEAVEQVQASGPIQSFSGVLNGTTNFVLDCLAEGQDLKSAVQAAQDAGYAEANCRLDLNGTDAAHKLILLARNAFSTHLKFDAIERIGIEDIDPQWVRDKRKGGEVVRFVASCEHANKGLHASVKPTLLPHNHPLARATGVDNRLLIKLQSGASFTVSGKGAGRWPTTEAVIADLLDIRRETQLLAESEAIAEEEVCA